MLAAKLQPQRVQALLVPRTSLVRDLNNRGCHPKVTVICAPAGYGKSTLMHQLMESRQNYGEVVCWLSLDSNDNDLDTFSNYLLHSYNEAILNHPDQAGRLGMEDYKSAGAKQRLSYLFGETAAVRQPVTMVLDDFHTLNNDKLFRFIGWMLRAMPNNLSLIIGSRTIPDIAELHDLRAKAELVEVSNNKVKFSLSECKEYFLGNRKLQLSEKSIELLYQKTEGWIAALQLAMLALQDEDRPERFVLEFSGNDKDIVAYLGSCVIAQLNETEKAIMLRTSVLEQINGELCTLLTGNPESAGVIAPQEKTGSFIFALDRKGQWFRYHHLFRELLLAQLNTEHPGMYYTLCLKAAKWFRQQGNIIEAIAYYLKARNFDAAADLIAEHAVQVAQYRGQHETLFGWLRELPEQYIFSNPTILVSYVWSLTFTHQFAEVGRLRTGFANFKQRHDEALFERDELQYLECSLEMLEPMADIFSGYMLSANRKGLAWLKKWPNPPRFDRGCVLGIVGGTFLHTLEFDKCRGALIEASNAFHACGADYGIAWMDCIYALMNVRLGFLHEAQEILDKSLSMAKETMGEYSYSVAMQSLGLGEVYYQTNRLAESETMIANGFHYIEEHGFPDSCIAGYVTRAKLFAENGRIEEAISVLIEGERFGRKNQINNFEAKLSLERGKLLLKLGNIDGARALLTGAHKIMEQQEEGITRYEGIILETFKIRLSIAEGRYEQVLEPLKNLLGQCRASQLHASLSEIFILQSRALLECGDELGALRALENATGLCEAENSIRIWVDEYDHLKVVLPKFLQHCEAADVQVDEQRKAFLDRVSKAVGLESSNSGKIVCIQPSPVQRVEKLTKREREILRRLENGMSNQQLADAMFISLATLKWHLSNIYTKLGVKNRIQAMNLSREI